MQQKKGWQVDEIKWEKLPTKLIKIQKFRYLLVL